MLADIKQVQSSKLLTDILNGILLKQELIEAELMQIKKQLAGEAKKVKEGAKKSEAAK